MDTKQPEALRLAEMLERPGYGWNSTIEQYAAELRRLHAENEAMRTGYNAARLEIESLQTRIQELGQQARECSDRKVVQLESALARHVRSGKDWAMRVEALERTITTLRAHIASRNAQVAAAEKAMRELESANSIALQLDARIKEMEAQLDAVGAGGVEPLRKRECLHQITEPDHFRGATEMVQAAAPVVLPEPVAYYDGERWYANEESAICACADMPKLQKVYTEQQVRTLLATGGQAQAVPNGWREQFATEVYADLEAADNQDVPLEEYPARILKVLDSTVGPRHPVVIKWRNDAIEQCIAIARKYCRDPESHKYLKQDLEAMLTAEPAPQVQADAADAARWHWLAEYLIGPRTDLDNEIISCGSVAELGNVIDTALAAQGV